MQKIIMSFLLMCLVLTLLACSNDQKDKVFKGEGENWSGELITSYNFWGEEIHSIKVKYKGENPEQLKEIKVFVESQDFLGWGIGNIKLNEQGIYNSGEVAKVEPKTPSISEIKFEIDGDKPETILLNSNS